MRGFKGEAHLEELLQGGIGRFHPLEVLDVVFQRFLVTLVAEVEPGHEHQAVGVLLVIRRDLVHDFQRLVGLPAGQQQFRRPDEVAPLRVVLHRAGNVLGGLAESGRLQGESKLVGQLDDLLAAFPELLRRVEAPEVAQVRLIARQRARLVLGFQVVLGGLFPFLSLVEVLARRGVSPARLVQPAHLLVQFAGAGEALVAQVFQHARRLGILAALAVDLRRPVPPADLLVQAQGAAEPALPHQRVRLQLERQVAEVLVPARQDDIFEIKEQHRQTQRSDEQQTRVDRVTQPDEPEGGVGQRRPAEHAEEGVEDVSQERDGKRQRGAVEQQKNRHHEQGGDEEHCQVMRDSHLSIASGDSAVSTSARSAGGCNPAYNTTPGNRRTGNRREWCASRGR